MIWALFGTIGVLYGLLLLALPVVLWLLGRRLRRIEERLAALEIGLDEGAAERAADRVARPTPPPPGAAGAAGAAAPTAPAAPGPPAAPAPPAATAPRRPPRPPAGSAAASKLAGLLAAGRSWLLGGNTVARVGILVLFVGVALFLRYSVERGWIPIELRLLAGAAGGFALVALGWRLRGRRRGYALALQGGGLGVVYLTVFAAVGLYRTLPPLPGLALMVVLVALGGALAVLQSARSLAALAALGGFLAPVLVPGGGSHGVLFSYYAVLDLGIVGVARFRAWRELNLLGFAATFVLAGIWGHRFYRPEHFATTEPFLVFFFLLFLAVPVLFAWRRPPKLGGVVDGSLVFGVPLVAFGLQSRLVAGTEFGLALSALAAGLVYAVLATVLWRRAREAQRPLVEAFAALAVAFGTVAVPLAVDGRWTGAAWALEGAALLWLGVRQSRPLARASGGLVQLAAGVSFALAGAGEPVVPVLDAGTQSALMIAVAGGFSAWTLARAGEALRAPERVVGRLLMAWGLLWWLGAGWREVEAHGGRWETGALLAFASLTAAGLVLLDRWAGWRDAGRVALLLLPALALLGIGIYLSDPSRAPTWLGGVLGWPLAVAVLLGSLGALEERVPRRWLAAEHAGSLWLVLFVVGWEASWAARRLAGAAGAWPVVAWAVVPIAGVLGLPAAARRLRWPLGRFADAYLGPGLGGVVAALGAWVVAASSTPGDPRPLPYLPLANPLEIGQALALGAGIAWLRRPARGGWAERASWAWGLVGFVALNGAVARAAHHLRGVGFEPDALWASPFFQTLLSITWTLTALAVMVAAARLARRPAWLTGASLLAVVVAKLALVDLADTGTVARIVSFVGVGLLMLLTGYLSPMPPARPSQESSQAPSEEAAE